MLSRNNTRSFSSYLKFIIIMYLTIPKLVMVGLNSVCLLSGLTINSTLIFFFFHLLYFFNGLIMHSLLFSYKTWREIFVYFLMPVVRISTTFIWLFYYPSIINHTPHSLELHLLFHILKDHFPDWEEGHMPCYLFSLLLFAVPRESLMHFTLNKIHLVLE